MPLTASDCKLMNSKPEFVAALNATLHYAEQNANLSAMMNMAAAEHVVVMFNPPDNPLLPKEQRGQTVFGTLASGEKVILWNPNEAALVWNVDAAGNKIISGIASAADGFFHEAFHVLDPIEVANWKITDSQYENMAERGAGRQANADTPLSSGLTLGSGGDHRVGRE